MKKIIPYIAVLLVLAIIKAYYPVNGQNTSDEDLAKLKAHLLKNVDTMGIPFTNQQKEQWADCVISMAKANIKKDISADKATKFFVDCANNIVETQKLNGWTQKFENKLYNSFYQRYIKEINDSIKVKNLVSCMLIRIKAEYPSGLDLKDLKSKPISFYKGCY